MSPDVQIIASEASDFRTSFKAKRSPPKADLDGNLLAGVIGSFSPSPFNIKCSLTHSASLNDCKPAGYRRFAFLQNIQ